MSLRPKTISRLKAQWGQEYDDWRRTDLGRDEWVYIWADGLYSGLRGSDDRLCGLGVIGVNTLGEKHFLAIEDGVRESTQSWREVLLGLTRSLKTVSVFVRQRFATNSDFGLDRVLLRDVAFVGPI